MTWEETIKSIRNKPEFKELVRDAYFDSDLQANVELFRTGDEFRETLSLIKTLKKDATQVADIGSGNGISSIAFALAGFNVYSVEPDPSSTIGAGAIRELSRLYNVEDRIQVIERFGEDTGLRTHQVDIAYIRQAMHHAHDLKAMMKECSRILRPGGLLITVRDHVIFDDRDKKWFLDSHPLHKFYGGENAFTENEYRDAMLEAGFTINRTLKYYDSSINYFPLTKEDVEKLPVLYEKKIIERLRKKIGGLASLTIVQNLYKKYIRFDPSKAFDEQKIPGRLYTFLAIKS